MMTFNSSRVDEVETLSNVAAHLLYQENWEYAIKVAKQAFAIDAFHINTLDTLSHCYGALRNWEMCGIFGAMALQLRDQNVSALAPEDPILPAVKPHSEKNIIAFSLYGDKSSYIEPAVINAQIVKVIYPNWVCRFYVDDSVPEQAIQRLNNVQTEVIRMTGEQAALPGTMWRFLAMDDPTVNYILFRDVDSVISQREAKAVKEWIASGQRFHTIRDSGSHTELILAGLWGAKSGSVPNMFEKMKAYMEQNPRRHRFNDQFFLRDCVWPYVRQDVYASDRLFGFMNAHPIPDEEFFNFDITHIGCDEGCSQFTIKTTKPDELKVGMQVMWRLYSQIAPLLNEDLSHNLVEERVICEYPVTITEQGQFSGHIPRRYARGFSNGESRITFSAL